VKKTANDALNAIPYIILSKQGDDAADPWHESQSIYSLVTDRKWGKIFSDI